MKTGVKLLASLPRVGLCLTPSPVTALPELAAELGFKSLHVKRDDLLPALFGGTKVRKLDFLLASEPYAKAQRLAGIGAIGSGLMVALTAACEQLRKPLDAHLFLEEIDAHVLDNLAFIASRADRLFYYRSRAALALASPGLFTGSHFRGAAVVPPGATNAAGIVGAVAGGLELAEQAAAGVLPMPQKIFVALGSAGTAVGLSVGLALAGARAEIVAVTAIEKPFSREAMLQRLTRDVLAWLTKHGVAGTAALTPLPIRIDRSALGRGYGAPTASSIGACERLRAHGVHLESVYSGKAMAALLKGGAREDVLFWQTNRGAAPFADRAWRERLPLALRHATVAALAI